MEENLKVTIENDYLVVRIKMQPPSPSMLGKTLVVASTHGNQATSTTVGGKNVIIGLNAYIKK